MMSRKRLYKQYLHAFTLSLPENDYSLVRFVRRGSSAGRSSDTAINHERLSSLQSQLTIDTVLCVRVVVHAAGRGSSSRKKFVTLVGIALITVQITVQGIWAFVYPLAGVAWMLSHWASQNRRPPPPWYHPNWHVIANPFNFKSQSPSPSSLKRVNKFEPKGLSRLLLTSSVASPVRMWLAYGPTEAILAALYNDDIVWVSKCVSNQCSDISSTDLAGGQAQFGRIGHFCRLQLQRLSCVVFGYRQAFSSKCPKKITR
ncbi:hypothetical protein BIW11_04239 [Tropilaelaps mercedesae]|uniref:Uncharacterized protein n=1 Tax=Tropilaelaps mercedesae TaxID=418985 RepID=A0A1V9X9E6_9ACAR|nr:hypothetical protein BIW11_04239 [Tropilaelaps mercedesae]